MTTDPISDMLTRIRNATAVHHHTTTIPSSKMKEGIAKILVSEGYLDGYDVRAAGPHRDLVVSLKYDGDRRAAITGLRRVSTPGRRIYRKAGELPRAQGGLGVVIVSTSQGLMPDREARRRKLGGEIVCEVW